MSKRQQVKPSDFFELTMINDTSEEFYVEFTDNDGRNHRAGFPVRDATKYPNQHAYAVQMVGALIQQMTGTPAPETPAGDEASQATPAPALDGETPTSEGAPTGKD